MLPGRAPPLSMPSGHGFPWGIRTARKQRDRSPVPPLPACAARAPTPAQGGLPDGRFHQAPRLPVHRGRARAVARRGSRLEDTRGLRRGSTHSPPTVIFAIFFTGRRGTSAPLESACPKRHPASLMSRRMACKTADAVAVVNAWTGPDATGPGRGKRHHARPRAVRCRNVLTYRVFFRPSH